MNKKDQFKLFDKIQEAKEIIDDLINCIETKPPNYECCGWEKFVGKELAERINDFLES